MVDPPVQSPLEALVKSFTVVTLAAARFIPKPARQTSRKLSAPRIGRYIATRRSTSSDSHSLVAGYEEER